MDKMIEYVHEAYILSRRLTKKSSRYATDTDAKRIDFTLTPEDPERVNANSGDTRIIYTVRSKKEVVYVGEASSGLETRFKRGFSSRRHFERTGKARKGYKGYRWADLIIPPNSPSLHVDAFIFGKKYNAENARRVIEGIEGELVFLIRRAGEWPDYQNEIHFSNQEGALEVAEKIFGLVIG